MNIGKVEIIFFIFVILPFLVGIFFFLRSLIKKKSIGCGFSGMIVGLLPFFLLFLLYRGCTHETKREFISEFERDTKLSFPQSGKIVTKDYASGYLDFYRAGIIAMDTLDYEQLLRHIQSDELHKLAVTKQASFGQLKKRYPARECAYLYIKHDYSLWFHTNRQIVVYEYDRKNPNRMIEPTYKKYGVMEHVIYYETWFTENVADMIAAALTETTFFDDRETKKVQIVFPPPYDTYEIFVYGMADNHEALHHLEKLQPLLPDFKIDVIIWR